MSPLDPAIGNWYRFTGGEVFEIVALDEDDGTIELQYFDGTVEEMDLEDWQSRAEIGEIQVAAAPEDWSGSVDMDPDEDMNAAWRGVNG
ncbi:MAG: DUF6763 family protein [Steroidobacteraceae bacterium]